MAHKEWPEGGVLAILYYRMCCVSIANFAGFVLKHLLFIGHDSGHDTILFLQLRLTAVFWLHNLCTTGPISYSSGVTAV